MPKLDLVVIGASAGGLSALMELVEHLPDRLPLAILIVVHKRTEGDDNLPGILARYTSLPVAMARDGEAPVPGHIYIAPGDVHLLVAARGLVLRRGPRENGFRPAIDPLFRSAARVYGPRVMGVILSGALDDGTYGLQMVKAAGGLAVVQDPEEAEFPGMPMSAIRVVGADYVLSASAIGRLIAEKSTVPVRGGRVMARKQEPDPQNPAEETEVRDMTEVFGPPSGLTCPDCGGALWEIKEGNLFRYRCHVGHQYSQDGLDAQQRSQVEEALWTAVRALEEHVDLRKRLASRAEAAGLSVISEGFSQSAHDSAEQANTIRELLFNGGAARPAPSATSRKPIKHARAKTTRRRSR